MALSDEEYAALKAEKRAQREAEEKEKAQKEAEFRRMRAEEIMTVGELRLNIASRVAASLSANMAIEPEAITDRAFQIADAMLAHIEDEIDNA